MSPTRRSTTANARQPSRGSCATALLAFSRRLACSNDWSTVPMVVENHLRRTDQSFMSFFAKHPDLVEPFRRGEREALARIYEAFVREVEVIVRRGFMTGAGKRVPAVTNDADVRDLVQECFVRAFADKARKRFDVERPYRPYLLRIVKNLMIDQLRGSMREVPSDDATGIGDIDAMIEGDAPLMAEMPSPSEDNLRWKRLREAYAEFQQDLDDEEREFIRWRYREELSQRDVAERMDVSRRRVRTLQNRIHRQLERYLQDEELV